MDNSSNIVWPKYTKCLKKYQPNLSAQAQKFQIFEKKLSLSVRSPWLKALTFTFVRPNSFLSNGFTTANFLNQQFRKLLKFTTVHLSSSPLVSETRILKNPFCLLLVGAVLSSVGGRCKKISECSNQVLPQSYQQQSWRLASQGPKIL